jgi:hypothetical protein
VGPALGAAAAAALTAFGVEQAGKVLAANTGGRVPVGIGSAGIDSVPAVLTPGELVVPNQNFDEVVNAVAAARGQASGESSTFNSGVITINLEPQDDLINFIQQKIIEVDLQNTGV